MQRAGIQKGGRSGPNMRSTTRAPSALALQSAARTSAGTSPAELGEGRLSCDLTWFSDHWGGRLSCDLTWISDHWITLAGAEQYADVLETKSGLTWA